MRSRLLPVYKLNPSRETTQLENMWAIVFEKVKGRALTVNKSSVYAEAVVGRVFWKRCYEKISAGISFLIKLNSLDLKIYYKRDSSACVFMGISWNMFEDFFCGQKSTTWQLLLIIAVLIVVKGDLRNETVNYATKNKA